jgi:predicted protein tyrosine phosphatase
MDLHIVTLEITNLVIAFDHYDSLVSGILSENAGSNEEHQKIRAKSTEHLAVLFNDVSFYDEQNQLKPLAAIKDIVSNKLADLKAKDIHELVEKLEKDAKKMKKLYKAIREQGE